MYTVVAIMCLSWWNLQINGGERQITKQLQYSVTCVMTEEIQGCLWEVEEELQPRLKTSRKASWRLWHLQLRPKGWLGCGQMKAGGEWAGWGEYSWHRAEHCEWLHKKENMFFFFFKEHGAFGVARAWVSWKGWVNGKRWGQSGRLRLDHTELSKPR